MGNETTMLIWTIAILFVLTAIINAVVVEFGTDIQNQTNKTTLTSATEGFLTGNNPLGSVFTINPNPFALFPDAWNSFVSNQFAVVGLLPSIVQQIMMVVLYVLIIFGLVKFASSLPFT